MHFRQFFAEMETCLGRAFRKWWVLGGMGGRKVLTVLQGSSQMGISSPPKMITEVENYS